MPQVIYLGLQAFAHEPHQLFPSAENPLALDTLPASEESTALDHTGPILLPEIDQGSQNILRQWLGQDTQRELTIAWPHPQMWLAARLAQGADPEQALDEWQQQGKTLLSLFRSVRRQLSLVSYAPGSTLEKLTMSEVTDRLPPVYQLAAAQLISQNLTVNEVYDYLRASSQVSSTEQQSTVSLVAAVLENYCTLQSAQMGSRQHREQLQHANAGLDRQQHDIARLKGELTAAREEYALVIQQLQSAQEALSERVDEQKAHNEKFSAESAKSLEQAKQNAEKLQKENAQMVTQSEADKQRYSKLEQDYAAAKKAQLTLQQEKETLDKALKAEQGTQQVNHQALAKAQKENAWLLDTLQQAQQAYEVLDQEYQALGQRKNSEISQQQRLIDAQQQNLDNIITKLERRVAELHKVQEQLDKSTLDQTALRKQLEKSTLDEAHWRRQNEKRQKELNVLRTDSQQHIQHLERLVQWLRVHAQRHAAAAYRNSRSYKKALPRQVAMLEASPFFDAEWYLESYPDVAQSGINPAEHFIKFGAIDGRHAGPLFSTAFYLTHYEDVAASGQHPLLHYLHYGMAEQRQTHLLQHQLPAPAKGADV